METLARERYIPQRVGSIIDGLSAIPFLQSSEEAEFRGLARLLSALYHYDFYDREQELVAAWERLEAANQPGPANHTAAKIEAHRADEQQLTGELTGLLHAANYSSLTVAEIAAAFENESLVPLRLEVDLDDYNELLVYHRGTYETSVELPRWKGLRREQRTFSVDERVVVHTRIKSPEWFAQKGIDPAERNLVPGSIALKQFQDVPQADIEMLLPSAQVRFRLIDTLMVGVPAVISGVIVLATKLLPTLGLLFVLFGAWLGFREQEPAIDQAALVVLFGGTVTLGAFFFKQYSKLKNRRVEYLKTLSENLYFRTLGDGVGVIHTLLSSAQEQETIEALIAYRMLLASVDPLTPQQIDERAEAWLLEECGAALDFEISDAIDKLERMGLATRSGAGGGQHRYLALSLADALRVLDQRWDNLFRYHQPEPAGTSSMSEPADQNDPDGAGAMLKEPIVKLRKVVDRFTGRFGNRTSRVESG